MQVNRSLHYKSKWLRIGNGALSLCIQNSYYPVDRIEENDEMRILLFLEFHIPTDPQIAAFPALLLGSLSTVQ